MGLKNLFARKIDNQAVDGLLGVVNSLAYKVAEIERHLHGWERWMGLSGSPNGEIHVASNSSLTGFELTSGNDDFGVWVQVLGSSDTPVDPGKTHYDLHRITMTAVGETEVATKIQIAFGASGSIALAAKTLSDIVMTPRAAGEESPFDFIGRRSLAGTKAWARLWVAGENAKTLSFVFGIHEYEG